MRVTIHVDESASLTSIFRLRHRFQQKQLFLGGNMQRYNRSKSYAEMTLSCPYVHVVSLRKEAHAKTGLQRGMFTVH